jgi:hypothetical protein
MEESASMRFHRVAASVWPSGGSTTVLAQRRREARRTDDGVRADALQNRQAVLRFFEAWSSNDLDTLRRLSADRLSGRWVGFQPEPVTAVGLEQVLATGRDFELRHGATKRYAIVEALAGSTHVAVLVEPDGLGREIDRVARVAVYRLEAGRVASIAVYADRND